MKYWLMKSEPDVYSFKDLERDRKTLWNGVRNFQARNHLRSMKKGDLAIFYHTGDERCAVGIMEITSDPLPDPGDDQFVAVEVRPSQAFARPVTLHEMKNHPILKEMAFLKQSRLSVAPIQASDFKELVRLGKRTS